MIKSRKHVLAIVIAGVGAGLAMPRLFAVAPTPILALPPYPLGLETETPHSVVDGDFLLSNPGGQALEFAMEPSCGCTELVPKQGSLPPGGVVAVKVAVKVQELGTERNVQIKIESNDPNRPTTAFFVTAKCLAPLSLAPKRADFGIVKPSEIASAERTIVVRDVRDEPLADSKRIVVANPPDFVDVEVKRGAGPTPTDGARLIVRPKPGLGLGRRQGAFQVSLTGAGSDRVMEVPVVIEVCDLFEVAPASLSLDPTKSRADAVIATIITWRRDGKPLKGPTKMVVPEGLAVRSLSPGQEASSPASSTRQRWEVRIADPKKLKLPGRLEFWFPDATQALTVTLLGKP